MRITGLVPRSPDAALAAEPASVQERWFARLYLLKPVVLLVFGLFWIVTGLVTLGPGFAAAEAQMSETGAAALAAPAESATAFEVSCARGASPSVQDMVPATDAAIRTNRRAFICPPALRMRSRS